MTWFSVIDEFRNHEFAKPDNVRVVEGTPESVLAAKDAVGGWNGTHLFEITPDMLAALQAGKVVVGGVSGDEYGVVIRLVNE